ncbi:internalin, partial [Erysipelothrix rhusiopathiae]|nr:internalin [Erysipelothrix rhusiopathiae]
AQWEKNIEVKKTYEVVYRDGIQDENSFKDQVYEGLEEGSQTPEYVGTPQREGYRFKGWSPKVSESVTENTVYVAQWEKNIEVKKTYEVV